MPLLNTADAVRLGASAVGKVYLGAGLVWPPVAAGLPFTTGLLLDWDMDGVSGADGDTISNVPDASGNSRAGTCPTGDPVLLKTGLAVGNGHKALRFDGFGHAIHDAASTFVTGTAVTLFVVGVKRFTRTQTCTATLTHEGGTADYANPDGCLFGYTDDDGLKAVNYRNGSPHATLAARAAIDVIYVMTFVFQADGGDRIRLIQSSGTTNASASGGTTANFAADRFILAKRAASDANPGGNGDQEDFFRVLLYSGDVSGSDQTAVESYLDTTYSVT